MEAFDKRQIIGYKFDINSVNRKSQTIPKGFKKSDETPEEEPENPEVSQVMGFSSFGRTKNKSKNETKNAKKFDIEKLMAERPNANKWKSFGQSNDSNEDKNNSDSNDSDQKIISKPESSETKDNDKEEAEKQSEEGNDSESDDDLIGPPLPPGFGLQSESKEKDDDRDSD